MSTNTANLTPGFHPTLAPTQDYRDIIHLSRPTSSRPKMPLEKRAAQFAPFSALTGYDELIETAEAGNQYFTDIDFIDPPVIFPEDADFTPETS